MTPPRESIAEFFDRYRDAFDALDGDAVAALWHVPGGIADARGVTWWPDAAPLRANMLALCAAYRGGGYRRASFELGTLTPMGAHHAHADVAWRLHRADGSLLQAFRTGYHLIRIGGGWRVLLATAYEEDLAAMQSIAL